MPAEERFAAWERSERRADIAHHLGCMRTFERDAAEHAPLDLDEAVWIRDRIEGHAIRAIVALLEWGFGQGGSK